ncbi:MAG: iron uptake porin [Cyanobacteria bacterium P01_A01_bin.84]
MKDKSLRSLWISNSRIFSVIFIAIAIAGGFTSYSSLAVASDGVPNTQKIQNKRDKQENKQKLISQVTSVSQLSDVQPTDWAFSALQKLVEQYGCIAGYPNGTFRGNRAVTRYEFAAGLNACLDRINELTARATSSFVRKEDLAVLQRLQEEFSPELATLRGRVDTLEARTAELEANQFSTTTKLKGEVAFTLADTFGDDNNTDTETIFTNKVRLQLVSSFTGKDKLYTRLTSGNIGNSFADELGTNEGRFAYDGPSNNNVVIDRLHYVFPVGKKLKVTTMASLGAHHFYADVFNPGLNTGGGATGALSRFGERNPIYRLGIARSTTGAGFSYKLNKLIKLEGGYLAKNGSNPEDKAGLFNGSYSALGQLVIQPTKRFKVGFTYVNGYDPGDTTFAFGGTGTNFANGLLPGTEERRINSNSYGVQAQLDLSPKFSIRGWGSFSDVDFNNGGEAEIWNYAIALAFPDLGKKGSLGGIIAGAEPYAGSLNPRPVDFKNDTPIHLEAFYRYPVNDNISITPGLIWLTSPNQNQDNDDIFIGTLRTTFKF